MCKGLRGSWSYRLQEFHGLLRFTIFAATQLMLGLLLVGKKLASRKPGKETST